MILGKQRLIVRRDIGGAFVAGRYQPAYGVPFPVIASIQPAAPEAVQLLPVGARTSAEFMIFAGESQSALKATIPGSQASDLISFKGSDFKLFEIGDWTTHQAGVPHRVYVMVKVGADEVV